jgi:hypothetical protein
MVSHFVGNRLTDGVEFVGFKSRRRFTPEDSWYLFLLEAESNPRPWFRLKDYGN